MRCSFDLVPASVTFVPVHVTAKYANSKGPSSMDRTDVEKGKMDRTVDKKSKEGRTIAKKEFFSDAEEEALQVRQTLLMMEGSHALNVPKINEVYTQAREAADNLLRILKHGNCISRILCPVLCMTTPPDNSNQSRKQSSGFKFFSKKKTKAKQAASQRSHMVLQATLPSPPIAEDSSVVYDLPYWPSEPSARSNTLPCRVRKHSSPTGSSTLPSCFSRLSCKLDRKVWPIPPPPAIPAPNPPTPHDAGAAVPFTFTQPKVGTPQNFHLRQGSNPQHHFHPRQGSSSQQHSHSHLTQVRQGSSSHRQDHLRQEGNPQHHSHLRQGGNPQHHSHLRQEDNPQHHSHLRQEGNPQHHSHLRQEGNPQHHSHLRQEGNPHHHSHLRQEGNPQHHSHLRQGSSSHSTHNRVYPRPVSLGKICSIPPPKESGPEESRSEESGSEEYICHVCRGEANTATYMNVTPSSALLQMSDKETEGYYVNIH